LDACLGRKQRAPTARIKTAQGNALGTIPRNKTKP
jgi:hypothetical protein